MRMTLHCCYLSTTLSFISDRAVVAVVSSTIYYITIDDRMFLGRHFGCRPLDPTRDIWSNFVKKKKEKRKKAFYLLAMSQEFPRVTKGYQRLPMVTRGYFRLPQVTTGYHGIPRVTTGYH